MISANSFFERNNKKILEMRKGFLQTLGPGLLFLRFFNDFC